MGLQKEIAIDHVLYFMSPKLSHFAGRALWAALDEVGRYFSADSDDGWLTVPVASRSGTVAHLRAGFRRWYVAAELPPGIDLGESGTYRRPDEDVDADLLAASGSSSSMYDHQAVGARIAEGLELNSPVVVFDQEITPPPDWRYLIWDSFPGGAVISFAPIDPLYWGYYWDQEDEPGGRDRLQEIKQGVRSALMSVTGSFLGLSRCENPSCFMFAGVDSVSQLAEMRSLGDEHEVGGLARGRFESWEENPDEVATPVAPGMEAS